MVVEINETRGNMRDLLKAVVVIVLSGAGMACTAPHGSSVDSGVSQTRDVQSVQQGLQLYLTLSSLELDRRGGGDLGFTLIPLNNGNQFSLHVTHADFQPVDRYITLLEKDQPAVYQGILRFFSVNMPCVHPVRDVMTDGYTGTFPKINVMYHSGGVCQDIALPSDVIIDIARVENFIRTQL